MSTTAAQARQTLLLRQESRQRQVDLQVQEVRRRLPMVAAMLRRDFGAQEVILFGSLAWGHPHEDSDVDLAVAGVPVQAMFSAAAAAEALLDRTVDLVDLTTANKTLAARIAARGQPL